MCHSLITLAASRTENQPQTHWSLLPWCRRPRRIPHGNASTSLMVHRLTAIGWYPGWFPFFGLTGSCINCVSFFDAIQTNHDLSGQLHLYVAQFCLTRHIHSTVAGGLLALKPNAFSSTATWGNTRESNLNTASFGLQLHPWRIKDDNKASLHCLSLPTTTHYTFVYVAYLGLPVYQF